MSLSALFNELCEGRISDLWRSISAVGIHYPCALHDVIWLPEEPFLPLPAPLNSLFSLQHHLSASFLFTPLVLMCFSPCALTWWFLSGVLSPCTAHSFAKQRSASLYLLAGLVCVVCRPQLSCVCLTRLMRCSEHSWWCEFCFTDWLR